MRLQRVCLGLKASCFCVFVSGVRGLCWSIFKGSKARQQMMSMMWIGAVIILILSEARSEDPVVKNVAFTEGTGVNLTCSDKMWKETFYIIWDITPKNKTIQPCRISFAQDGSCEDTCKDGRSLQNTSSFQPYLHIPHFSRNDEGVYKCHSAFKGDAKDIVFNVALAVPPSASMWLEKKNGKTLAVCRAERGTPAANISWSHAGNSSSVETLEPDGHYTVESRLLLPEGIYTGNVSCIIKHPSWNEEKILVPIKGSFPWLIILPLVIITIVFVGFLFIGQKKLRISRQCQQLDTHSIKSPTMEDVEVVEPYASYVQRVNSIYNSSADLFT